MSYDEVKLQSIAQIAAAAVQSPSHKFTSLKAMIAEISQALDEAMANEGYDISGFSSDDDD